MTKASAPAWTDGPVMLKSAALKQPAKWFLSMSAESSVKDALSLQVHTHVTVSSSEIHRKHVNLKSNQLSLRVRVPPMQTDYLEELTTAYFCYNLCEMFLIVQSLLTTH